MSKLKMQRTVRGFGYTKFQDSYNQSCSIQKSSSVVPHIWLGVDNTGPHLGNQDIKTRMYLNTEQVATLIPILQHFVKTEEVVARGEAPIIKECACSRMYDLVSWRELPDPSYQAMPDTEEPVYMEQRLCSCGSHIAIGVSASGRYIYDHEDNVVQDLGDLDTEFMNAVGNFAIMNSANPQGNSDE